MTMTTSESDTTIDDMMSMARTLGKIQWRQQGQTAANDSMSWLGAVDRAIAALQAKDVRLALENMRLAHEIEQSWPKFEMIAGKVVEVLLEML